MLPLYSVLTKEDKKDFYWALQWNTDFIVMALWLWFYYKIFCRYADVKIRINNNSNYKLA